MAVGLDSTFIDLINKVNEIDSDISGLATVARTGSYNDLLNKPLFIGTTAEYETANGKGLVPVGTIVIITDDTSSAASTSAILGQAILGQMILG